MSWPRSPLGSTDSDAVVYRPHPPVAAPVRTEDSVISERSPGDRTIEEASIPFVAAATDILTGEEIVLDSGPMIDGIRASISVPGVFAPHTVSGRFLVDGGLVNPVPVDYLRLAGIDVCVAVNVVPRVDRKYIEQPSVIDVLLNAFDIMEHRVILSRNQPADIEICPTADQVSGIEFWRAKELMRLGEEAARDSIDRILEAIGG